MIYKENRASVGNPSVPWGWMLNDQKIVFRLGLPPKTGPVPRPDRQPSPAFAGLRRPLGRLDVVCVVYCSHTPEESAD